MAKEPSSGSRVLTEIKNRGTEDVCIVVCDGLKGLPEAIGATWPPAIVQTCVLHLIRNTFRFASKRDSDKMSKDLRPVYTAVSEHEARERFVEFGEARAEKYPAIIRLWENVWVEFVPFLDYSPEVRKVIPPSSRPLPGRTGGTEMPLHGGACLDPTGTGRRRWTRRWKAALNAFAITRRPNPPNQQIDMPTAVTPKIG